MTQYSYQFPYEGGRFSYDLGRFSNDLGRFSYDLGTFSNDLSADFHTKATTFQMTGIIFLYKFHILSFFPSLLI